VLHRDHRNEAILSSVSVFRFFLGRSLLAAIAAGRSGFSWCWNQKQVAQTTYGKMSYAGQSCCSADLGSCWTCNQCPAIAVNNKSLIAGLNDALRPAQTLKYRHGERLKIVRIACLPPEAYPVSEVHPGRRLSRQVPGRDQHPNGPRNARSPLNESLLFQIDHHLMD